ncbi:MAG TPA: hypothetical protein VNX70_07110, partial [Bryobacteraceae bacterium]|nr:hypothetical protein [Bryobacteraceae bacterium]
MKPPGIVNPLAEYQRRLAERSEVAERQTQHFRRIGNARLGTGIVGVIVAFFVFGETVLSPWWLAIPALLFSVL